MTLVVQRAGGELRRFNEAGVLVAADVQLALRLGRLSGETSERVLVGVALMSAALRQGSVCLDPRRIQDLGLEGDPAAVADLDWPDVDDLIGDLKRSPLVIGSEAAPLRPIRIADSDEGSLLYFTKYFQQENTIRRVLAEREASAPSVDPDWLRGRLFELFPDIGGPDRQRIAAALAATRWTTVVAGGPGTGKTHTLARILALLASEPGKSPRIGLAAPTGKAAARMQEAVGQQAEQLGLPSLAAVTLHRLLGSRFDSFTHNASNRLPYDVVVIDEMSMVSLTMVCRLLEAMRPDARLIFVGDPDQLASVDAGAVLADLVARPVQATSDSMLAEVLDTDLVADSSPESLTEQDRVALAGGTVRLVRGHRFSGAIADLADAVRRGDADAVIDVLRRGDPSVTLHDDWADIANLRTEVVADARSARQCALQFDVDGALLAVDRHRLLCAHRDGGFGVGHWDRVAQGWVAAAGGHSGEHWYPGQPLLVTANDRDLKIYNGDTGVVVRRPDSTLVAAIHRADGPLLIHPSRIASVQSVYAMTIHRSQGSQYRAVSVVLPGEESKLLTRELLYTAITRAKDQVRLFGSEQVVRAAVARQVLRASGLRQVTYEQA